MTTRLCDRRWPAATRGTRHLGDHTCTADPDHPGDHTCRCGSQQPDLCRTTWRGECTWHGRSGHWCARVGPHDPPHRCYCHDTEGETR